MLTHVFAVDDAVKFGIEKATILSNLRFWLEKNKANERHIHDGYVWTYNSSVAFQKLFPYFTAQKVARLLRDLESDGILVSGNYNKAGYDRTKWYSIKDEYSIVQNETTHCSNLNNAMFNNEQPIPDINTDNKTDINKTLCPEQSSEPAIMFLPTKSKGTEPKSKKPFPITQAMINEYKKAYPNLDIIIELNKSKLWLESTTARLKTYNGMKKFITGWLNRANPIQQDYSGIPIDQIAEAYRRLLSIHTGYNPGLLSDKTKADIVKRWNGAENSQNIVWWTQFFSAIKNKIQDIDPQFIGNKYKLDKLVGYEFENVINEL